MTINNNNKSIENDITAIVKESGISQIILKYKSELESISYCNRCGFKYVNRFWKHKETCKTFCGGCAADEVEDSTTFRSDFLECFDQYCSGRHGIYRDVNKFNY